MLFDKLLSERPDLSLIMLEATDPHTVLFRVKQIILDAGIDEFIFKMIRQDIVRGNFSVMYLDDRIVGDDKRRIKAKKELEKVRKTCIRMQKDRCPLSKILMF